MSGRPLVRYTATLGRAASRLSGAENRWDDDVFLQRCLSSQYDVLFAVGLLPRYHLAEWAVNFHIYLPPFPGRLKGGGQMRN